MRLRPSITVFDRGVVSVETIDLPPRRPGEIDVSISTAAICGSDLHTVLGHRSSPHRTALGHEGVGRVTEADEAVVDLRGEPLRQGDRIVFGLFNACGECDRCARGLSMKCRSVIKYGHESVTSPPYATGTLASHVRLLPGVPVLRIPDDVTDIEVVSAGCAVATAAAIVSAAAMTAAPERILVLGAGAVGTYCAAMLTSAGHTVEVKDPSADRVALAQRFGARSPRLEAEAYPVVIEASGSADAFAEALGVCDIGGRLIAAGSVSPGASTVPVDPAIVVTRRLTVIGVHNYTGDDLRHGVDWLLAHGRYRDLGRLVSPPLPLSSVREAFDLMREGRYARVLVRPDAG
ncbi:alcohol dehydrogenase catalytic domain-containing protein [Phytoactinopolyspora alkaliphila]|uniref:Alcohol dehydrogenase catalytic domain-containing protein n=1 Tax=Phytoactinopolyspora alkaliphila TaxID=1783498 RepID=A0A6N9YS95_9ACTN|nr:alcohol dehydrogenase catalytic domain-containing protein [Phytoactinopolyspora alkaliphila]